MEEGHHHHQEGVSSAAGLRLAVRKGIWTEQEDELLRKCVEKYGQGEWHRVPYRAGLNRCRKSCRLRWFNYLNPNIKRGKFTEDEIDMIARLHKLLGNRWTLIAGRIPGRTANDVKNYWNTYMVRKTRGSDEPRTRKSKTKSPKTDVIKPRPRTISKNFNNSVASSAPTDQTIQDNLNEHRNQPPMSPEYDNEWWKSIVSDEGLATTGGGKGLATGELLLMSTGKDVEEPFDVIEFWRALVAD